jgi:trigger factor
MKKKILLVCLALGMVALAFGCGNEEKEGKAKDYVKVGKYKGLEIEEVSISKVTDADVEAAIRSDLQTLEQGTEVKGPAQLGDTTTIDYLGKINGVAFEGGEAKDHELTLGSGEFIEGFEEQVVGHNVGETFDINVTFPENYGNELAGKKAVFTINLKKIVRLPELTDDLLPKLGTKATTVKEYKELVNKELEESNKEVAQSKNQETVLKALVEKCEIKKYPTNRLIRITKELVYQESYGAIMNNLGIDQAVQQTHGKNVEEYAKDLLMTELAVEYIAEKEDIVVSEKEYEEKISELAAMYGETSVEGFVQSYESIYGEGYIKRMMLQEKVAAFLLKHAK